MIAISFRFRDPRLASRTIIIAACLAALLHPGPTRGQTEPAPDAAAGKSKLEAITPEIVESRRKEIELNKEIPEEKKQKILDFYRQAAESLKQAAEFAARAADSKDFAAKAQGAAEKAKAEQARLKAAPAQPKAAESGPPESRSRATLEKEATAARALLESLRKEGEKLEQESQRRAVRRKELRAQLLGMPDRVNDLRKQWSIPAPANELVALTRAQKTALRARGMMVEQESAQLETRLARYDAEDAVDLLRLQRDLIAQKMAIEERRIKSMSEQVTRLRREEAQRAVAEAHRKQVDAHPLLRSFAEENTKFAEEAQSLTKPGETAAVDLKTAKTLLETLSKQFEQIKQKADGVGLTGPIGQLLRKQRAALPTPNEFSRSIDERSLTIDEVQFRLYELDEMRSEAADPAPTIQTIMEQTSADLSESDRASLAKASHDILDAKKQCLDTLVKGYSTYYDMLLELVITQRKLVEAIDRYADYIDERVLWIRSSRPLTFTEVIHDQRAIGWLITPANWQSVWYALASDVRNNPLPTIVAFVVFSTLLYMRRRFCIALQAVGHETERGNFAEFAPTMRAFSLTLLISSIGPGILWYLSRRIAAAAPDSRFPIAIAEALLSIAWLYWPLDILRQSCRPSGLLESHFGWKPESIRSLRWNLRWLILFGLPTAFAAEILEAGSTDASRNGLERVVYSVSIVMAGIFLYRVLRPMSGVLPQMMSTQGGTWGDRLQIVWRTLGLLGPIGIAALVVAGYEYTARQLAWRLYQTGILLLAAYMVRATLMRWILIHRRRVGMQQLKDRRVAGEQAAAATMDSLVKASILKELMPRIDLAALTEQSRKLVGVGLVSAIAVGLWFIWLDIFPSINILNQWSLWPTDVIDANGKVEYITAGHLALAIFIAGVTWVAVRNIPGLLEITLLQRLPLDNASRFAIGAVARYAIVMVGLVLASHSVGIGWAKVQWLATALTFGLAFGLQEIFANFIAGLIILFERPVRVGDIVTIDNVTGVVSRIRIRATTITNWDRKEFIVPNKEFITGRLLNWTLSDTINRVVINVGIAYWSDTEVARSIMLKIAEEHPSVLKEPAPSAGFEEFGDNTLKLVLKCFLANMTERSRVIHELNTRINAAFAAEDIDIPSPSADARKKARAEISSRPALPSESVRPKESPNVREEPQAA